MRRRSHLLRPADMLIGYLLCVALLAAIVAVVRWIGGI